MRAHLDMLRLDLTSLSATLEQAQGEQLAAHRIEWQPREPLRIGVTEAARYRSTGWQPLYLVGAIPYVLVQRLYLQKEPDSLRAHRNNILTAFGLYAVALVTFMAWCWCGIARELAISTAGKWLGFVGLFGNYIVLKYLFYLPASTDGTGDVGFDTATEVSPACLERP